MERGTTSSILIMDKLHQEYNQIIIDINSSIAYLNDARDMFIDGHLIEATRALLLAMRELISAMFGITKFK
jgi:hypothetical protein